MKKTVIELFAGVGGFRLGLENSDDAWKTVWANQWEPGKKVQHAFDCYVKNFGESDNHTNVDIAEVDKNLIPDANLLVGGFPCQDYSVATTLKMSGGIQGKKGVLWWSIRDTLMAKNPSFVLLENVDRLLKSPSTQRGRDFGIMLACFKELDYTVEWRVINAADYGQAQKRRRTFIFAYKNNTKYAQNQLALTQQQALIYGGFFAKTFPVEKQFEKEKNCVVDGNLLEISDEFQFLFENTGIMRNGEVLTLKTKPIYEKPTTLREIMESNVGEEYNIKNKERWEYLKGGKRIDRVAASGHEYVYSEGAMSFPDHIDSPARTILTGETGMSRSSHVVPDFDTGELRLITQIEAERIQGFPDNWTNTGMPPKFRYFCMGNALVVGLVERMGKTLSEIFDRE